MKACVVHSVDIDSSDAAAELLAGARNELGSAIPRAGILFAGIDHDIALVLQTINDAWPGIQLIGCTTDGEFSSHAGFAEDSLALLLLAGDDFTAVAGVAKSVSPDSAAGIRSSVEDAMRRLASSGGAPRLCITTPLGLNVSASAVLNALRDGLGNSVPIFGGTAADQWRFKDTWQFHGTDAFKDAVPFLLFGEGVVFSFGVETGWRPVGREGRVTDAAGPVVRRIDGQPATAFYREFLGTADITHLAEYPLAVTAGDGTDASSFFLRASSATDETNGWLHFLGDVPAGSRVHITATNRDQILAATRTALQHALDNFPKGSSGGPALAVCFSCAGRKQILGSRTHEEGKMVNDLIGDVPAVGFYGYGEIAPLVRNGMTHYHNETFTVLLLGGEEGDLMESDEVLKLKKEIRSLRKQVERLAASRATYELMSDRNGNLLNRLTELAERERNRLARDVEIARDIQIGLLPKSTPTIPGYEIGGWSQAAVETGGDYFDWLQLADGRLVVSIADATGHGIGPALLVTACRAYFRAASQADEAIERAVARVNDLLSLDLPEGRFVTAAMGTLDPRTHALRLYSAGHGPQFYYHAQSRKVEAFGADELPLGVSSPMDVGVARSFNIEPGDSLLLITDGFHEWHNPDSELYGLERLTEFLIDHHDVAPAAFIKALHTDVLAFSHGTEQADDLTAVVIKRNPVAAHGDTR